MCVRCTRVHTCTHVPLHRHRRCVNAHTAHAGFSAPSDVVHLPVRSSTPCAGATVCCATLQSAGPVHKPSRRTAAWTSCNRGETIKTVWACSSHNHTCASLSSRVGVPFHVPRTIGGNGAWWVGMAVAAVAVAAHWDATTPHLLACCVGVCVVMSPCHVVSAGHAPRVHHMRIALRRCCCRCWCWCCVDRRDGQQRMARSGALRRPRATCTRC